MCNFLGITTKPGYIKSVEKVLLWRSPSGRSRPLLYTYRQEEAIIERQGWNSLSMGDHLEHEVRFLYDTTSRRITENATESRVVQQFHYQKHLSLCKRPRQSLYRRQNVSFQKVASGWGGYYFGADRYMERDTASTILRPAALRAAREFVNDNTWLRLIAV